MAKICIFCGKEIIPGFISCEHNWAWREIDDENIGDFIDELGKRNNKELKDTDSVAYKGEFLQLNDDVKEVVNGISTYDYEEYNIEIYVDKDRKKAIAFSNKETFLVNNQETSVIDLLYEKEGKNRIYLTEKIEKEQEKIEEKQINREEDNVEGREIPLKRRKPIKQETVQETVQETSFLYKDVSISKDNIVSAIFEQKTKIFDNPMHTQEFLSVLKDNEKYLLPIEDERYVAKFHAVLEKLYACPSLGVFLYALHGKEASLVGEKYTLYPIYDVYYGVVELKEKNLSELRNAYKFRKYWSNKGEEDCFNLLNLPAVHTVFSDFYLPKVLIGTAISADDRRVLFNVAEDKTQKQNLIEYLTNI